jgi:hypothetical protein
LVALRVTPPGGESLVNQAPVDNFVAQNVTSVTLKQLLGFARLDFYRGSS